MLKGQRLPFFPFFLFFSIFFGAQRSFAIKWFTVELANEPGVGMGHLLPHAALQMPSLCFRLRGTMTDRTKLKRPGESTVCTTPSSPAAAARRQT